MSDRTLDQRIADSRAYFADYTMAVHRGSHTSAYLLRKPGHGGMEGVDILFTSEPLNERIVITGDLCPNDNQGCISDLGHGLGWFARRQGTDSLCAKFLRTRYVPQIALERLVSMLTDEVRDSTDEMLDDEQRSIAAERVAKIQEAIDSVDHGDDPTRSAEAFHEWWTDTFDNSDDIPGYGYDLRDAALLTVICETFGRLYAATKTTTPKEDPTA